MPRDFAAYQQAKELIGFDVHDVANLQKLAPIFERRGRDVTEAFYDRLAQFEATRKLLEGRVDQLKATHAVWLKQLFEGDYGEAYFERRRIIGQVHVRIGLEPIWCDAVMNTVRINSMRVVAEEFPNLAEAAPLAASLLKVLDLDLMIINRAYAREQVDRLMDVTGIPRALLDSLVRLGHVQESH